MKLSGFRIENYRGIRDAYAKNLSDAPFVVMTGRNGTGKSLILEALAAVWAGAINLPDLVGPYANSLSVQLTVELSIEEYQLVEEWLEHTGQEPIERKQQHVLEAIATSVQESGRYSARDRVIEALQNPHFAQRYSFANIDLLSARRQPSIGTDIGVDLNLLDAGQNAMQRREMMQDEIRWKNAQYMPDVGSYLTALDYREYISHRDDGENLGEYKRLQDAFERATGKRISRPRFDTHTGRPDILVEVPSGVQHGLADLSNGEREMIGMFYYISQLASRGGVLLLDEPEKHLHPTLQNAVLEAITSVAGQGQALIVTHSPTIVAAVPQNQICSIKGAWETAGNQLQWASESGKDFEPLAEIGINPKDLLQMEAVLIVEGADDAKRLQMLLPDELARVKIVEAGGRSRAIDAADSLKQADLGIPHLCVVDRDYLTDKQVLELQEKGIFVWRARMFENVMLSAPLVADETHLAIETVQKIILECARRLKENTVKTFAEQRVLQFPVERSRNHSNDTAGHIRYQLDMWHDRLAKKNQIESEVRTEIEQKWEERFYDFVDGKKLLGAVHSKIGKHKNREIFAESILHTARQRPELMPSDFIRFRTKIEELVAEREESVPIVGGSSDLDERVNVAFSRTESDPFLNDADEFSHGCFMQ